jgi:hypothetical protein
VEKMNIRNLKNEFWNSTPQVLFHMARKKILRSKPIDSFHESKPCVFVLSTGRVGSETLAHLAGLAENMFSYHEPLPKLFALSKLAYELSNKIMADIELEKVFAEAFVTSRRNLIEDSLFCGRGYIETGPDPTFLAPIIFKAIPEVRFIHLVRDPEKVVQSGLLRHWYDGHGMDYSRIVPDPSSIFGKAWVNYSPYEKNLWLWAETNRWIQDFSQSISPEKYLLLHSEDVFRGHEVATEQFYGYLSSKKPSKRKINSVLRKRLNSQAKGTSALPQRDFSSADKNLQKFVAEIANKLDCKIPKPD